MPVRVATDTQAKAILVIGYGNTLRGDDGAGPYVAERLQALNLPSVCCLAPTLLTPESAEPVSRSRRVIFVDAIANEGGGMRFREVYPADSAQLMAHAAEPETILALARDVFGHAPAATLVTIPAFDFGPGETLSPGTLEAAEEAIRLINELVRA